MLRNIKRSIDVCETIGVLYLNLAVLRNAIMISAACSGIDDTLCNEEGECKSHLYESRTPRFVCSCRPDLTRKM